MQLLVTQSKQLLSMDQNKQHNYLAILRSETSLVITHFYLQTTFLLVHHLVENYY